jgi:uncharacterized protein (DUF1778 family)
MPHLETEPSSHLESTIALNPTHGVPIAPLIIDFAGLCAGTTRCKSSPVFYKSKSLSYIILYIIPRRILTVNLREINMSALSVRLPKSLHEQLREAAQEEGISVNQFVMLAIAEKVTALSTIEYLEKRGKRGSREKLLEVLNKVPDVEPEEFDRL